MNDFANFPLEIVQAILTKVPGKEIIRCRAVCKFWKDAVDGLADFQWKEICEKQTTHDAYEKAHEKSNLSWFDTFKAVNSWRKIETADLDCRTLPPHAVKQLKILPNRVIALLINTEEIIDDPRNNANSDRSKFGNAIVYYDADTSIEMKRNIYEKKIRYFDENEHMFILNSYLHTHLELYLIEKANNKEHYIGRLKVNLDSELHKNLILVGKKLYFQRLDDELIYQSELLEDKHGETYITTTLLKGSKEFLNNLKIWYKWPDDIALREGLLSIYVREPFCFGHVDDKLTILTYSSGSVFCYDNEELSLITHLWHLESEPRSLEDNLGTKLSKYGFDWSRHNMYEMLSIFVPAPHVIKVEGKYRQYWSACVHGTIALLGSTSGVDFFYNPFNAEGQLAIHSATPRRMIDFDQLYDIKYLNLTNQVEIIEGVDHHTVVVFNGDKVFLLRFSFDDSTSQNQCYSCNRCKRRRLTPI